MRRLSRNTKTDLTPGAGRLHYSLDAALSAHFRRRVSASERLHMSYQYFSTGKWADYRCAREQGSIV